MSNWLEQAAALFGTPSPGGLNGSRSLSGETRQTAVIFDALSEGEIDGLVNGAASVYLNGTSMIDLDVYKGVSAIKTTASISAGSTTATVAVGALDFADTTEGTRTILIKGAGKQGSSLFSGTAGGTTLTASSSWFTSGMASNGIMSEGASRLEIAGGGLNGQPYIGFISKYTSATSVEVSPPFTTTISGATGGIDLVSQIASYNAGSNQVTTTTAATTTVSGVAATLSPPFVNATTYANTSPKTNFESINYAFRAGTEDQRPVQMLSTGSPTASFVHAANIRLQQNATYDASNGVSDTLVTSADIGVPNPAETDQIKWIIECPQLFALSTKSGTEYNSWVEFTCDFEFSRDGGSSFTSVRLTGDSNSSILGRTGGYEYFNDQTSLSLHDGFIVNKTKKVFQEPYIHNIEQYKPFDSWRLRFKRVNEPNKPQSHHDNMNEAFVKFVEAQLTDRFTYPHTAYAAVKFNAKDFSGQPKRAYHVRGKKIQVPTNYLTREEMDGNSPSYNRHITNGANQSGYQDWDGNFRGDLSEFAVTHKNHKKTYCNNPAWVFYDIITDPRYGLGHVVDASLVDKYALYQIARYCDELVDNGKGGLEPRFTCNVYLSKATEAYKVLKDLATVFRGIGYWMDGQLVPVQDRPKEAIYTFTQGNVIDGEFSYEGTSERIRSNQVIIKWNDPEDQYKAKSHIVDDVDNIVETGRITTKNITAFGCTSEGQAHRIGKWALITDKVETELCSFSTSVNAGFIRPGDIINVQDQYIDAVQFSGRLKAGTSTTVVTLDRAVTLAANTSYELHLVYPTGGAYLGQDAATINSVVYAKGDLVLLDEDGAAIDTQEKASNVQDDNNNEVMLAWSEHSRVERQTISTSAGTIAAGSNITVDTAFSSTPDAETVWALTGTKNDTDVLGSAKQYRVMGIEEEGGLTYSIAAALYNDKKYDLVEKEYRILNVPTSQLKALSTTGITAIDTFIPKPETITFSIQQVAGADSAADDEESLTGTLEASIEWDMPLETTISSKVIVNSYVNEVLDASETTITLGAAATTSTGYGIIEKGTSNEEIIEWTAKSGSDITAVRGALRSGAKEHATGVSFTEMQSYETPYADLSNFEVEHTFHAGTRAEKFKREIVNGGETKLLISNALAGTHNVRVRSVSNGGQSSQWTTFENTIKAPGTVKATSKGNLAVGGTISSPIDVTTAGAYNIANSLYSFTSASGQEYNISQASASHAQRTQSFSGLSASNGVGYSVFDTSASASDPWRALDQKTDTTFHTGGEGTAGSFTWWKDVGASNIGLTLATGTITVSANTSTVTGSSTTFTSDFATGDMIRLGSTNDYAENTAAWYGYVDKVVSNTSLIVKGVVTKAFSSKFAYKQSFKPDFAKDTIVSKITRTASTAYTAEHFGSVPGSIGADGADGNPGATGADAYTVRLTANKYAIAYNIDGGESDTITMTASPQGIEGTATYKFDLDGVQKQAASQTATYAIANSDEPASGSAKVVKVTMFDDGVEKATDSVSVYGIQDGEDAVTVILTNEAHALPTDKDGNVTYTNSGTDIKIFKGSTALAYGSGNSQFTVSAAGTNITPNASPTTISTYTRRYGVANTCNNPTALITFTIIVKNALGTATTFTKLQTFNKTVDGATGQQGASVTGAAGLRTIQGYLFFEKTDAGAPSAPSGTTYTFSTGVVSGTGISDAGTTNTWRNIPRTQDATSSNTFYTIRYFGTEASAAASTITVAYSSVVQHTSFSGVVTFSSGTLTDGTSSTTPIEASGVAAHIGGANTTTIDGGKITTGAISSANLSGTSDGSAFTSAGMRITLSNGAIASKNFRVASNGTAEFKGTLKIGSRSLDATNTLNENTVGSDLGTGYGDSSIGGWALTATSLTGGSGVHIKSGQTAYNSGTGFYLGNDSGTPKFSIGNAGTNAITWDGSTMTIRGNLLLASGTAPTANQTDADALAAAEAGDHDGGSVGGWLLSATELVGGTDIAIRSGQTDYDTGTGFWLGNDGSTPKFSIGNASGNKMRWTGSALQVTGAITATSGSIADSVTVGSGDVAASTVVTGAAAGATTSAYFSGGILPRTRGGLGMDSSTSSGVPYINGGGFAFETKANLENANIHSYAVQGGTNITWSRFADGKVEPPTATYAFTIVWKGGGGAAIGTTVITANFDATNNDIDAFSTTSNGASATVGSTQGTNTASAFIDVTSGNTTCRLTANYVSLTSFGFKFS